MIEIRKIKKRLFDLSEQLAAKELAVSPKSYIMRESVAKSNQLLFENELMLP